MISRKTQNLAWCHALAAAYAYHLRGILANTSNIQFVNPMMAEFESHKVHLSAYLEATHPALPTRLLLLLTQVSIGNETNPI